MLGDAKSLRKQLRSAGLSKDAIDAAWPSWWSDTADTSPSARAELRFVVARSLGLSAPALVGERVEFVFHDKARFKNLNASIEDLERAALNSFGVAVGRLLISATKPGQGLFGTSAEVLRKALLSQGAADLLGLLSTCWALGIPVVHASISPLKHKAMHAMVIGQNGRQAILLSRSARYPALVAFTLAHEMAHIALGHVPDGDMLVDVDEPVDKTSNDDEEESANRYAREVLIGDPDPHFDVNFNHFNAAELADVALRAGAENGIDPGTIILGVAKQLNVWPVAMAALKFLYPDQPPLEPAINRLAEHQLELDILGEDSADFIRRVIGVDNA